jgi:holo-[acyl-carrier protein] synthase
MIVGIGTDIVLIQRIANLSERYGQRFARRILGPNELAEYLRRLHKVPAGPDRAVRYLAKRFAAKEAFSKAVGLGFRGPMTLLSVEFLNHSSGQPYAQPRKAMVEFMQERQWVAHVSISDEIETATAFVIIEKVHGPRL